MKKKSAVLINRYLSIDEKADLNTQIQNHAAVFHYDEVYSFSESAAYILDNEVQRELNHTILSAINEFGDKDIESISIATRLSIDNCHMWHYQKFRIYFSLRNLFYIKTAIEILQKEYSHVSYYGYDEALTDLIDNDDICLNISKQPKSRKPYKPLIQYSLFVIRRVLGGTSIRQIKNKNVLLFNERYVRMMSQKGSMVSGNPYLEYLIDILSTDYVILSDKPMPKISQSNVKFGTDKLYYRSCYRGLPKVNIEKFLVKGFFSFTILKEFKKRYKAFTSNLKVITTETDNAFERIIVSKLIGFKGSNLMYLYRYSCFEKYFGKGLPRTITAIDENSPNYKSILDAAKYHGIKTAGIQHGAIHDLHMAYRYTLKDKQNNVQVDQTYVWGEKWRKILISRCNFSAESILVTGQLRTDIIDKLPDNENNTRKLIVYASQPQRDELLRKRTFIDVINTVSERKNAQLILRPHPAEYNNLEYFYEIAKEVDFHNLIIDIDTDLYSLLNKCNVLITCFSTVGTEAIYFHKPVIILDYLHQDSLGLIDRNIGLPAYNIEMLKEQLDFLFDRNFEIDLDLYDKFISEYAYRIDGNCSFRIKKAIEV